MNMRNWGGTLTHHNVERVAHHIREMFEGQQFVIAKAKYADDADVTLEVDGPWSLEGGYSKPGLVHVYRGEDNYTTIQFSAGHYSWGLRADDVPEGTSHNNYEHVHVSFDRDSMLFCERSPAGYLFKYRFKVM